MEKEGRRKRVFFLIQLLVQCFFCRGQGWKNSMEIKTLVGVAHLSERLREKGNKEAKHCKRGYREKTSTSYAEEKVWFNCRKASACSPTPELPAPVSALIPAASSWLLPAAFPRLLGREGGGRTGFSKGHLSSEQWKNSPTLFVPSQNPHFCLQGIPALCSPYEVIKPFQTETAAHSRALDWLCLSLQSVTPSIT